jgi:hypothetical protein
VSAAGGASELVLKGSWRATFTPDGKSLLLYLMIVPYSESAVANISNAGFDAHARFSPDSRRIAVAHGGKLAVPDGTMFFFGHREESSRMVTVLQLPGGREMKTVAIDLDPSLGILSFSPHPDGRRIAVAAGRLNYDLWMMEGFPQPATGVARLFRHWEVRAPSALSH